MSKKCKIFINILYILLTVINLYFIFLTVQAAAHGVQNPFIALALVGAVMSQVLAGVFWGVCEDAIVGTYQKNLEEGDEDDV